MFAVKWFDCTDDTGSGATSWYAYDAYSCFKPNNAH
jgi:hypothetical protein